MSTSPDDGHGGGGGLLHVLVLAPGFVDPWEFIFTKNRTVREAAAEAAIALGYRASTPGFQTTTSPQEQLPEDQTLVAAGVRDGQTLELIDTGGGAQSTGACSQPSSASTERCFQRDVSRTRRPGKPPPGRRRRATPSRATGRR